MNIHKLLSPAQRRVLDDLRRRDAVERKAGVRTPASLMAVSAPVAELLFVLVLQKGARRVAEFGTSHGYSTLHLAAAAELTGGHVYSVDAMAEKTAQAEANLREAGLSHRVTLTTADGGDFAHNLPDGVDFVLVDYGAPAFLPALEALRPHLADGCLMFVDGGPDGYWETGGGRDLMLLLEADPEFLVSVLPMHKEQLLAVRLPHSTS